MASRTTLNISVPPAMKAWIDRQVKRGQFGTASEYLRHLVRLDQVHAGGAVLNEQLLEGLRGPMTPLTKRDWADIRREGRRRLAQAKRKSA